MATGGEKSAFDPDVIVDESEEAEEKEEIRKLQEMRHKVKVGELDIPRQSVQSEMMLGFRD